MYVYEAWKVKPLTVTPFTPSVICLLSDCRFDPISITCPSDGTARDCEKSTAPVPGTIDYAGTYTGRSFSLASAKLGCVTRFTSWKPYRLTPRA